jgi:hypothetical protein
MMKSMRGPLSVMMKRTMKTNIINDEKNGEKHNLLWGNEGENHNLS